MKRTLITTIGATISTLYTRFLERYKYLWEPYGTFVEVVIGELGCLVYFWARCPKVLTRREATNLFFESQVVLGTPIIWWCIGRGVRMLISTYRQRNG